MVNTSVSSEYVVEKRKTKFTLSVGVFVTAFLVVLYLTLALVFTNNTESFSSQSAYPPPCIDDGILPATPSGVSVRVLNGTKNAGLANAVADALSLRGFSVIGTDNANMVVDDTQIRFGMNATASAYTVAGNFVEPTMVLDDRTDGLIDIVVGRTFDDLIEQDLVSTFDRSKPLSAPKSCKPVSRIAPAPALQHDTSAVPAYKESGVDGGPAVPSDSATTAHDDSSGSTAPEPDPTPAPTNAAQTPDGSKTNEVPAPPITPMYDENGKWIGDKQ
jgi:hypothetical protein